MTHHEHHSGKHGHDAHHSGNPRSKGLHKDWRAWTVVILMLGAMLMYVLSFDESLQPGPEGPTDSAPVPAAP